MNETFHFRRFTLLVSIHLREHRKSYLLGVSALVGLWVLILALPTVRTIHYHESMYRFHGILFSCLLGITGSWFASEVFRMLGTPLRGIPYLMLPASQLEKFGVGLLMHLLFMLLFTAIFYGLEALSFAIINNRLPADEPRYTLLNLFGDAVPVDLRYLALVMPCLFLLGSLYFPTVPFVKTSLVALLLYFLVVLTNDLLLEQLLPYAYGFRSVPFKELIVEQSGRHYYVALTGVPKLLINSVLVLVGPALWLIAYLRLKEKEY